MSSKLAVFLLWGTLGALSLFIFYYLLTFLISHDPIHPFVQFRQLAPWMGILILGFGIQVGLLKLLQRNTIASLASKGNALLSGTSMIVCCAHHLLDFIPILGISGISVFLTQYQKEFLIVGIIANLVGILYMTKLLILPNFNKS